jgi:hypothetical protein
VRKGEVKVAVGREGDHGRREQAGKGSASGKETEEKGRCRGRM